MRYLLTSLHKNELHIWIPWPWKPMFRHQTHTPISIIKWVIVILIIIISHSIGGHLEFHNFLSSLHVNELHIWIPWPWEHNHISKHQKETPTTIILKWDIVICSIRSLWWRRPSWIWQFFNIPTWKWIAYLDSLTLKTYV